MFVFWGFERKKRYLGFDWSWKFGFLGLREERLRVGIFGLWERKDDGGLYRKDFLGWN